MITKRKLGNIFLMWICDVILILAACFISYLFFFSFSELVNRINGSNLFFGRLITSTFTVILTYSVFMFIFGMYNNIVVHSGFFEYIKILFTFTLSITLSTLAALFFKPYYMHPKIIFLSAMFSSILLLALRITVKYIYTHITIKSLRNRSDAKRVLFIGAGSAAHILTNEILANKSASYDIVGFIDDNPTLKNHSFCGYKILGNRNDIINVCKNYEVDEILIAIPSGNEADIRSIIQICSRTSCKVRVLPALDKLIFSDSLMQSTRDVQIEDLLERDPVILDNQEISNSIFNKTVLVTGGGGSIGSELCRQISKYSPALLIIFDIYENNAYDIQNELRRLYPRLNLIILIGSVRDKSRLEYIFSSYKPHMVFHAAAHKHVPILEDSPGEAIKNNVFGTYNLSFCANKYNVEKFVFISTDKAVNPTNVMGATKRMCEMIVQAMQEASKTEFVAVRFGNVLGSNGSVIPLFKKQIECGGPVTVTHKDITRFFMTVPEAAQLVLQASTYARGGEIFVLDMGQPVKIYDLAVNLIKLSGYRPNVDIKIEFTGLRPGEKLYEELLMKQDGLSSTRHKSIFIEKPIFVSLETIRRYIETLKKAVNTNDNELIIDTLAEIVPTFTHKKRHSA